MYIVCPDFSINLLKIDFMLFQNLYLVTTWRENFHLLTKEWWTFLAINHQNCWESLALIFSILRIKLTWKKALSKVKYCGLSLQLRSMFNAWKIIILGLWYWNLNIFFLYSSTEAQRTSYVCDVQIPGQKPWMDLVAYLCLCLLKPLHGWCWVYCVHQFHCKVSFTLSPNDRIVWFVERRSLNLSLCFQISSLTWRRHDRGYKWAGYIPAPSHSTAPTSSTTWARLQPAEKGCSPCLPAYDSHITFAWYGFPLRQLHRLMWKHQ